MPKTFVRACNTIAIGNTFTCGFGSDISHATEATETKEQQQKQQEQQQQQQQKQKH